MVRRNEKVKYGLGLGINTVRRVMAITSAAFNFAVREKLIADNPVTTCRVTPAPPSSANPLSIEEAWTLVSAKDLSWYGDAFAFNLQTGLRPEELMALIWDDIDFGAGTVRIERACKWEGGVFRGLGKLKSGRSYRTIELAPEHIEFLKARREKQKQHILKRAQAGLSYGEPKVAKWLKEERPLKLHEYKHTDLIFPSRAGNIPNVQAPRHSFKVLLRRAGFTGNRLKVRWYDLRHTHATFLLTMGIPDHEVAARLGHTVDTLNRIHAHVLKGRQRAASILFLNLIPLTVTGSISAAEIENHMNNLLSKSTQDLKEALRKLLRK